MSFYSEVIALKPGSKGLLELRNSVFRGDLAAAKKYVYWCALEQIRRDRSIPRKKILPLFKALVHADKVEVSVERVATEVTD